MGTSVGTSVGIKEERHRRFELTQKLGPIALPWYEGARLGFFDLETASGFKGNSTYIISWAIALDDGSVMSDAISQGEVMSCEFDRGLVHSFMNATRRAGVEILVGYYSTNFDLKFLRTRCALNKEPFWRYGEMMTADLYYNIKGHFALTRNSLDVACRTILGKSSKTHFDPQLWMRAAVNLLIPPQA